MVVGINKDALPRQLAIQVGQDVHAKVMVFAWITKEPPERCIECIEVAMLGELPDVVYRAKRRRSLQ